MKKLFTLILTLVASTGSMFATECFYTHDFRLSQASWTIDNKALNGAPYVWQQTSNYGMKATAYVDGSRYETESWLISRAITLDAMSSHDDIIENASLVFSHARKYGDLSQLSVRVKTEYDDTWTTMQVSSWPDGSNWDFVNATVDLTPFIHQTIQIAFVYTSTASVAATWEIKTVSVVEGICKGIFYYKFDDYGGLSLISKPCGGTYYGDVYIPDSINYNGNTYRVTSIGDGAFSGCTNLTSVKIPSSITSIGSNAFYNCTGLTSVTFAATTPNEMEISSNAFDECSQLSNVYVPCGHIQDYDDCIFSNFLNSFPDNLEIQVGYAPLSYKVEGKVSIEGTGTVKCPTICDDTIVKAVPTAGYEFVRWTDGNTDNPRHFTLIKDTAFTAEFAKSLYSITTQSSNPEWGITKGDTTAYYGDSVQITAIPNDGYHFKYWIGDSVYRCDSWSGSCGWHNWCMSGHMEYLQHPEQTYSVNVTSTITYTAFFEKDSQEDSIPEVAAPADGYVTVVIEIPEGSECNGIAFKGTLDGTNWSAPNTYVGETMADASVAQCIKFSMIDNSWYKATYKLGTVGLTGKVCLIFSNDDRWQGQAHDYSIIDAKTTANVSIDNDRNIVITNTGVVYVKIQSWADSECEDPTSRTVVLIAPPYICGGDAPTIAGEFNGWNPTTFPMTQIVNEYNMFCAKMAAKNIQYYKFAGLVNGWNNQIQIYDQEHSTWNDNPDLRFGNQAVIVVDYSAAYNHRWSKAQELPCASLNQVQPYSGSSVNITSAELSKGKVLIYDASTTLILIAVPEHDMQFVAWSDGNTENPRAITWEQDLTLTASFVESGTNPGTDIDNIPDDDSIVSLKLLRDGQILILRGDKTYTITGAEVK